MWMFSAGARLLAGMAHGRMGRYGAASPDVMSGTHSHADGSQMTMPAGDHDMSSGAMPAVMPSINPLYVMTRRILLLGVLTTIAVAACRDATSSPAVVATGPGSCSGIAVDPTPPVTSPATMRVFGVGLDTVRYQAGDRGTRHDRVHVDLECPIRSGATKIQHFGTESGCACPQLIDSVIVDGANTTGDVAVSDDGKLLVVATEFVSGSMATYDLTDPRHPALLQSLFQFPEQPLESTPPKLGRVNGKLYAFHLGRSERRRFSRPARDRRSSRRADEPPTESSSKSPAIRMSTTPSPRDGLLFVARWNDGMDIWDIGGGGTNGSPEDPARTRTW